MTKPWWKTKKLQKINKSNKPDSSKLDYQIIKLCDSINKLPGLYTIESCSGHSFMPLSIWFKADKSIMTVDLSLSKLSWAIRHYGKNNCHNHTWRISTEVGCLLILPESDGFPNLTFHLESSGRDGKLIGKKAYKEANEIAETLREMKP